MLRVPWLEDLSPDAVQAPALLQYVRQLVRQQALALVRSRLKLAFAEKYVATYGKRTRAHAARKIRSFATLMYADMIEALSEPWLHEATDRVGQRATTIGTPVAKALFEVLREARRQTSRRLTLRDVRCVLFVHFALESGLAGVLFIGALGANTKEDGRALDVLLRSSVAYGGSVPFGDHVFVVRPVPRSLHRNVAYEAHVLLALHRERPAFVVFRSTGGTCSLDRGGGLCSFLGLLGFFLEIHPRWLREPVTRSAFGGNRRRWLGHAQDPVGNGVRLFLEGVAGFADLKFRLQRGMLEVRSVRDRGSADVTAQSLRSRFRPYPRRRDLRLGEGSVTTYRHWEGTAAASMREA
jgi:hypothetical protein